MRCVRESAPTPVTGRAVIFLNTARQIIIACRLRVDVADAFICTLPPFAHGRMKKLIAFRCEAGNYLLVSPTAFLPWLENPSVEFLGEVNIDSFEQAVAESIDKQMARWNVARVSKVHFCFAWSRGKERTRHVGVPERRRRSRSVATQ